MPSFRQILTSHSPVLLLDAASALIQVGWFDRTPAQAEWATLEDEAGVGIFRCLEELKTIPARAGAFVFCEGPGSVLGIRTTAMAIRTWNALGRKPVFTYQSLAIVAHALAEDGLTVIADARRDSWHAISTFSPLRRVGTAQLSGALITPEGFRNWTPLPGNATRVPYLLSQQLASVVDHDLFRLVEEPDAFLHEEPTYAKWSPQIHRAP